ncbi:MAG: SpoVA/SpoVAEb family sporulation membrane protein [Clostridia bacterium]|nr:SpoVA/SpoVAEb family sporulation membrane protein [Clostridia bacterium]
MNTDNKTYKKYAEARAKKSPVFKDCMLAFFVGGAICTLGHGLKKLYLLTDVSDDNAGMLASVTLIFLAILVTGLGKFDDIAKHAGAGTLVPITGFANAVSSCAIDNKSEGFILGVGAKIFTIAGPVILYGISAGVVYGVVYWVVTLL